MLPTILFFTTIFLFGIVIGSFLNVCIYRIPNHQSIVPYSRCMNCEHRLMWYDLFPVFSYIGLGGKCRYCKVKLSIQYPVIEALNGILYLVVVGRYGVSVEALLYCLLMSALLVLSVIDFRTYEIPFGINVCIFGLGIVRVVTDWDHLATYLIGFVSLSAVLLILYYITNGRGIGGGDVKLMAATGLLLGWQCNLLGFVLSCIVGSVIHVLRMRLSGEDHVLALGPYLSIGVAISALWGNDLIQWYLITMLGF